MVVADNTTIILSICIVVVSILIIIFALLLRYYKRSNNSNTNNSNTRTDNTDSRGFGNGRWVDDPAYRFGERESESMIPLQDVNRERLYFASPPPQSIDMVNAVPVTSQLVNQQQPLLMPQQQPSNNIMHQPLNNIMHQHPQNIIMPQHQQQPTTGQKEIIYPGCENVTYDPRLGFEMINIGQPVPRVILPPIPQMMPQRPTLEDQTRAHVNTTPESSALNVTAQPKQQFVIVKKVVEPAPPKLAVEQKNFVQPVARLNLPPIPQILPQNQMNHVPINHAMTRNNEGILEAVALNAHAVKPHHETSHTAQNAIPHNTNQHQAVNNSKPPTVQAPLPPTTNIGPSVANFSPTIVNCAALSNQYPASGALTNFQASESNDEFVTQVGQIHFNK